ncbi:MAG: hypothetical protein Kilf2KO_27930 [Rhodospirillales bacterium]
MSTVKSAKTGQAQLSLSLLGGFQILAPAELVMPTRKVEALLAYLALPAGQVRSRSQLTALLWGGRDERHGRHSLNQALSSLRKLLAPHLPDLLQVDASGVWLAAEGVTSDVARMEAALERGSFDDLLEAASLFNGDLLAGMELREEAFEAWRFEERRRLKDAMMSGFHGLLDRQLAAGDRQRAVRTARMILRIDCFDEPAHRRLMQIYLAIGQRNAALQQFHECSALLRRELDVAPEAATRALYQQILRGQAEAVAASDAPSDAPSEPAPASLLSKVQPRQAGGQPPAVAIRHFQVAEASPDACPEDRAAALALEEDLLSVMARDRGLAVVSHRGLDAPLASGGYLVEGSLRRQGEEVCITAHLLDVERGTYLWSERWCQPDGPSTDGGQRVVRLAAVLKREIERAEARRAAAAPAEALGPWAHYHLALRQMYRFALPGLKAARHHLERALSLDPDLAAAQARLAYVHLQLYWYGPQEARACAVEQGLDAAERAVGLDPREAQGHFALGRLYALRQDFDQAIPEFEMALSLDGGLAQAHFGLGQALSAAGLPGDGLASLDRAIALDSQDPHLWTFYHDRAEALFALGRLAEAEQSAKQAVRLPNASHFAWATLVSILGARGRKAASRGALERLQRLQPGYSLAFARDELAHHANRDFVALYLDGLQRAGLIWRPPSSRVF